MALTLNRTEGRKTVMGSLRCEELTVDFDSSYPTNGESGLTPAALGMDAFFMVLASPTSGYVFEWDYTNNLLLAYRIQVAANSTVADGNNSLIKDTGAVIGVAGTGTAFGQALSQVANTTNLSTLTGVRVIAFGV